MTTFFQRSHRAAAATLLAAVFLFTMAQNSAQAAVLRSRTAIEQALIAAEDHRLPGDEVFAEALARRESDLRALAVRALGRIGDASRLDDVVAASADRSERVRKEAAFALGQIGGAGALDALKTRLVSESSSEVARELYRALGRVGSASELTLFAEGLDANAEIAAGAAQGLGSLFMTHDATLVASDALLSRLIAWSRARRDVGAASAFALARYKTPLAGETAMQLIEALRVARSTTASGYLLRAVAKLASADAKAAVISNLAAGALSVRIEAARALGNFPFDEETATALRQALGSDEAQFVNQTLLTVTRFAAAAAALTPDLETLAARGRSSWIRGAALETLAVVAPESARPLVVRALSSSDLVEAASSLRAAANVGGEAALRMVLPYLESNHVAVATAASESVASFDPALVLASGRDALLAALLRHDLALTANIAAFVAANGWREFAAPLAASYDGFTRADDVEAKVAVLDALALIGDQTLLPLFERALADSERVVALAAAKAYEAVTGTNVMDRVPTPSVSGDTPSIAALRQATRSSVLFHTTKGDFLMRMLAAAPLAAHNHVALVARGYYDGLSFHRVVPHFVVQGGDPRGDGYGGPGYLIRDEFSTLSHRRGTVGMASAGKDTAGSQFFVNHDANLHLDGNYTVFAVVTRGMDVVDRLEVGDRIIRAEVLRY